jgi:peptidoglycan/LPS O-acetylase OafA/YrhL
LFPLAALAGAAVLLLAHVGMKNDNYWFWYDSIINQLPILLLGIILFMAVQDGAFRPNLRRDVAAFLFTGALAIWVLYARLFGALPFASAISFVFLFNILRVTSTSYGLVERIGRSSYSMYVFHTVFAVCATRAVLGSVAVPESWETAAFAAACVGSILATYLVGRASEKLIEHPFIALGRRLAA